MANIPEGDDAAKVGSQLHDNVMDVHQTGSIANPVDDWELVNRYSRHRASIPQRRRRQRYDGLAARHRPLDRRGPGAKHWRPAAISQDKAEHAMQSWFLPAFEASFRVVFPGKLV